jgi:hypothetical protein
MLRHRLEEALPSDLAAAAGGCASMSSPGAHDAWCLTVFAVNPAIYAKASPGGSGSGGPAPPATPEDKAKSAITTAYAAKSVSDGDAAWKADELKTVSDAFAAIPAADKAVLKGLDIERVHTIDPTHSAQYSWSTEGGGLQADGSIAPATQTTKIKVADAVYSDKNGTPVPASEQKRLVVHELGHAVANQAKLKADLAETKAVETFNRAIIAFNSANDAANVQIDEENQLVGAFNDVTKDLNAAIKATPKDPALIKSLTADRTAAGAALAKKKGEAAALKKVSDAKKTESDKAKTASEDATKKAAATRVDKGVVDAGAKALQKSADAAGIAGGSAVAATAKATPEEQKEGKAYQDAFWSVAAAVKDYSAAIAAGHVDPDAQDQTLDAAVTRDAERDKLKKVATANPVLAAFAQAEAAQNDLAAKVKTQARLPDRSKPVQLFVDVVTANGITPTTPYAQQNWPFAPEEFYAEAYSIWRTDPASLRDSAKTKPLFEWFEKGKYR